MVTKKEFNTVRSLVEIENQLIYRFQSFEIQAKEPQLKEEFQKMLASLKNQKATLLDSLEV
ncbi:MAG: hypothetical protein ACI4I6_07555 [Hominimerdicola sp.]